MTSPISRRSVLRTAVAGTALAVPAVALPAAVSSSSAATVKPTVILVHGAWADGSSWRGVTELLQHDGFTVYAVPNPERGVAVDSAYVAKFLSTVPGPIVLVGHSYGGFVISNAAVGNAAVTALVYIDAYIPAAGDTLLSLTGQFPGSKVSPAVLDFVPSEGVVDTYIKRSLFPEIFANDMPAAEGAVLSATQRPLVLTALSEASGAPAWASIHSWALIGSMDLVIPPAAQRFMTGRAGSRVTEIHASHLSMVSHPHHVTRVIIDAAGHC